MHRNDFMYLIKRIDIRMRAGLDAQLKENDLTMSQSQVLWYIMHHGGQVSQKEVQHFLNVSHPTVVGLVKRLENSGFIETGFEDGDKRNKILKLTDKAIEVTASLDQKRQETDRQMVEGLSSQETEELKRMLNVIYENIQTLGKEQ